jgi:hypothetical protein
VTILSQCLTPTSTSVTDQVFDVTCGVISSQAPSNLFVQSSLADAQKVLVRTFSARTGITTFSCYQTVYVRQNKMEDIVFPTNVTLTCGNLRTDPTEAVVNNLTVRGTGSPIVGNTTLNATAQKGFIATYTDVRTTTPTGFTIQRTWTVNRCAFQPVLPQALRGASVVKMVQPFQRQLYCSTALRAERTAPRVRIIRLLTY